MYWHLRVQVIYVPRDEMTWAETGAKQVGVLVAEGKWAFISK
jgi:hypothetical protein